MRKKRKIGEYGDVGCTQCMGKAYPTREQPDDEWLLRVQCTSCGTIKTWDLREKPTIEAEIFGKDDVRGRNQKGIMEEIELPWWDEEEIEEECPFAVENPQYPYEGYVTPHMCLLKPKLKLICDEETEKGCRLYEAIMEDERLKRFLQEWIE